MRSRSIVGAAVALATVAAIALAMRAPVGPSAPPGPSPEAIELTVYGAASLKGALEAARSAYEAAVPGTTLLLATDSSAALATQIEQGAPADVFLSADSINPQALVDAGLADGTPITFARNALTVIVPADNPAGIATAADLGRPGVLVVAAGDEVPITRYATQLIDELAQAPGAAPGFAAGYAANIVSREDNVKAVVAKIELGEGDAAIVYRTDAAASDRVATVEVPAAFSVTPTYDGVVVKASRHRAEARAFLEWFAGPGGQEVLGDFGFLPPS